MKSEPEAELEPEAEPDSGSTGASMLPAELRRQFSALRARLWRTETFAAICGALALLTATYLLLFLSDRIWPTPSWIRVIFSVSGLLLAAVVIAPWIHRWHIKPRDTRTLSRMVQGRFRRLGDRLLGIVELSDPTTRPAHYSPALYHAAIRQVAEEARPFDFTEAVNRDPARRAGIALGVLGGCVLLLAVLLPAASWNVFLRWIQPTAAVPHYTLVRFASLPDLIRVPHGESFEFVGRVERLSFWNPSRVQVRVGDQPPISTTVSNQAFRVEIPGQVEEGTLSLRFGDSRGQVNIVPTLRPSLLSLVSEIIPPEYLRAPSRNQNVSSGTLTAVDGSRVRLTGEASRDLDSARLFGIGSNAIPLEVQGAEFRSEALDPSGMFQINLVWKDEFGLTNRAPWPLTIQLAKDLPPSVDLPGMQTEVAMLVNEVLEIDMNARDDFGLKEFGFHWQIVAGASITNAPQPQYYPFDIADTTRTNVSQSIGFSPPVLQVPANSVVELSLSANDYFPNRESVRSRIVRIHVLGIAEHAELVRQHLEAVMSQLEEVTRLEEAISAGTKEINAATAEELKSAETAEKLDDLNSDQLSAANELSELAWEGMHTLREAMRNPSIDDSMMSDWAEKFQAMQDLARQKMKEAAESLRAAAEHPGQREQKLGEAIEQEQDVLQALSDLQAEVNDDLDALQALTLAQRLRKLSAEEVDVREWLQKIVPSTVGLDPGDLPDRFKQANLQLAESQDSVQESAVAMQGEISRFFERTGKLNYGEVSESMKEQRTEEELRRIWGFIQGNISLQAIQQLDVWAERFIEWAEQLEPPKQEDSGDGGGDGGGEPPPGDDSLKHMLAFLRAREAEIKLKAQTTLLEQHRETVPDYPERAAELSDTQNNVWTGLDDIVGNSPEEIIQQFAREIQEKMETVTRHLDEPRTDAVTLDAEQETIHSLTDAINFINEQQQQQQQSQSAQSAQSAMEFLMQMAQQTSSLSQGMAMNPFGGGNLAGGDTDRASSEIDGDGRGRAGDERAAVKTLGTDNNLPTEFRRALEYFYEAIEQETP